MIRVFLVSCLVLIMSACSTTAKKTPIEQDQTATATTDQQLVSLLSDDHSLLKDSEFSIVFPDENHPAIKTFSVLAKDEKINISARSSRKKMKATSLDKGHYKDLINKLKQLDESELEAAVPEGCREPFNLKVRVGAQKRVFVGCRGLGPNATAISRIARQLEYLLIKSTSDAS